MMHFLKFVAIGIVFQSCALSCAFTFTVGKNRCGNNCSSNNSELPREAIRQMRIEYFQKEFLRKLHLQAPPKINSPKPSIKPLLAIEGMMENDTSVIVEKAQKSESVVIYPLEGATPCVGIPSCYLYNFSVAAVWNDSVSADAWFFRKNLEATVEVEHLLSEDPTQTKELIQSEENEENKSQFVMFSLTSILRDITRSNILTLRVTYKDNSSNGMAMTEIGLESPIVILNGIYSKGQSRTKRSSECVADSVSCCREIFEVDFAEMGWDNWILYPKSYEANFCRGQCYDALSSTRFSHSTVMLNYIRGNNNVAEQIGITLCCTPSAMSPLTILYRDEDNYVYHRVVENMKADECHCA